MSEEEYLLTNIDKFLKRSEKSPQNPSDHVLPTDIVGLLYSIVIQRFAKNHWGAQHNFTWRKFDDKYPLTHHRINENTVEDIRRFLEKTDTTRFIQKHEEYTKPNMGEPQHVRLPLYDNHVSKWILDMFPVFLLWICTKCTEKHERVLDCLKRRGIPQNHYSMETYPYVLSNLLQNMMYARSLPLEKEKVNLDWGWNKALEEIGGQVEITKQEWNTMLHTSVYTRMETNWPFRQNIPLLPQIVMEDCGGSAEESKNGSDGSDDGGGAEESKNGGDGNGNGMGGGGGGGEGEGRESGGSKRPSSMLIHTSNIVLEEGGERVMYGIDAGSNAFKCVRGQYYSRQRALHIRHFPKDSNAYDIRKHSTSSFFFNLKKVTSDERKMVLFRACHGVHPRSLIAAGIPPESSPYAKLAPELDLRRYKGVGTRNNIGDDYYEFKNSKSFCISRDNEDMDDTTQTFATPSWVHPEGQDMEFLDGIIDQYKMMNNKEPFYNVDGVFISPYFTWALYVMSWFEKKKTLGENPIATILVPNIMQKEELSYVEYSMRALLGTIGFKHVIVTLEGLAETLANEFTSGDAGDDGYRLCVIAGGCTGDVNIVSSCRDEGTKCGFKSTHLLGSASSTRFNQELAEMIMGRLRETDGFDDFFNSTADIHTQKVFFNLLCEYVDGIKSSIEEDHYEEFVNGRGGDGVYRVNDCLMKHSIDVKISLDEYMKKLKECLNTSVVKTIEAIQKYFGDRTDKKISKVFFSGGVFHHKVGAYFANQMLHDQLPSHYKQFININPEKPYYSIYGAGAVGSLALLLDMARKEKLVPEESTIVYERYGLNETRYACPKIHQDEVCLETHWRFHVLGRNGKEYVEAKSNESITIECTPEDGRVYLAIVALKVGHEMVSEKEVIYTNDDSVNYNGSRVPLCTGYDDVFHSMPFSEPSFQFVKVKCRVHPIHRQIDIDITPKYKEGDGPSQKISIPIWYTISWPGACQYWRMVSRLCHLNQLGHDSMEEGQSHYEQSIRKATTSLSNKNVDGVAPDFIESIMEFDKWILNSPSKEVLLEFCKPKNDVPTSIKTLTLNKKNSINTNDNMDSFERGYYFDTLEEDMDTLEEEQANKKRKRG